MKPIAEAIMIPIRDIEKAAAVLAPQILRTPLVHSPALSRRFGAEVFLKLENLQKTGSFKIRGASYRMIQKGGAIGPAGVVAASAGNHAQGVALAAKRAGVRATIVMPEWVSISKQEATRGYGGEVVIHGRSIGESLARAKALEQSGMTFIHPFDDDDIMAGQGTVGLEVVEDLPDVDAVLCPVGGGGLIAGVASAVRSRRPDARIIGVQADACPALRLSLAAGRIVEADATRSIADGIAVKRPGERCFQTISRSVETVVTVTEEQIAAAILMLLERKKILAEGAGAAPLAALLGGAVDPPRNAKVVLIISGGNVDSPLLDRVIRQGLVKNGRVMRLRVELADVPGSLARLLAAVAGLEANVLHIHHDRNAPDLPIQMTRVNLELETRGPEHVEAVVAALKKDGYFLTDR